MRRIFALLLVCLALLGCEQNRNSPAQQVEDYKICLAGGMTAFMGTFGEIKCYPPVEA